MDKRHFFPGGQVIEMLVGDITSEPVDAIVNAANERLMHGGGLAGAIARKGGRRIEEESATWVREHGAVTHATPAYTSGGDLPSNYVIHAVGPVWGSGEEDEKLAAAVTGSLRLADKLDVRTLALPAISTGIFGFPKARAAGVILGAIEDYFIENENSGIDAVRLMLFDEMAWSAFDTEWERRFRG